MPTKPGFYWHVRKPERTNCRISEWVFGDPTMVEVREEANGKFYVLEFWSDPFDLKEYRKIVCWWSGPAEPPVVPPDILVGKDRNDWEKWKAKVKAG